MTVAMYPGRFDPVTNGHLDIVKRARSIYDEVIVGVAHSNSALFTTEERIALFESAVVEIPDVRVVAIRGLTVEAAREHGAQVLVKGLRALTDFHAEFDMALMNRKMAPEVESTFLMTSLDFLFVSASRIRELAGFGYPVDDMVPPGVAQALKEKLNR